MKLVVCRCGMWDVGCGVERFLSRLREAEEILTEFRSTSSFEVLWAF